MFVYVVVCLLAFVSTIVILSVLIPTCYHRPTFVVFVVCIVVNVVFHVVFEVVRGLLYCECMCTVCIVS